jgi:hypothetical protein
MAVVPPAGLATVLLAPYTVVLVGLTFTFFFLWPLIVYFRDAKGKSRKGENLFGESKRISRLTATSSRPTQVP